MVAASAACVVCNPCNALAKGTCEINRNVVKILIQSHISNLRSKVSQSQTES